MHEVTAATPPMSGIRSPLAWGMGALLALACALRGWQGWHAALWLDEVALALPLRDLGFWQLLTQPLPHEQAAPKGFLLLEKAAITVFGSHDHVLRALPWLMSLAGVFAFAALARALLPAVAALIAVMLFATAAPLVYFSAVVKPYAVDVAVTVLLLALAWRLMQRPLPVRTFAGLTVAGALSLFLSYPALLVLGAVTLPVALSLRSSPEGRASAGAAVLLCVAWGAAALAAVALARAAADPDSRAYLEAFWAAGFPPDTWQHWQATAWPWPRLAALVGGRNQASLGYPWPQAYLAFAGLGFLAVWRRHWRAGWLLTAPLLAALAAAGLREYPLGGRVSLFLLPIAILAIAAGIDVLARTLLPRAPRMAAGLALVLALPTAWPLLRAPPPYRVEPVAELLDRMRAHHRPDDSIYVHYATAPAFQWYAPAAGFARARYRVGGCHRGRLRRYVEELATFRGQARVWVVIAHAAGRRGERRILLRTLDAFGRRLHHLQVKARTFGFNALPAEAFLYDLSGAQPWPAAPEPVMPLGRAPGCEFGPEVMAESDFACGAHSRCVPVARPAAR